MKIKSLYISLYSILLLSVYAYPQASLKTGAERLDIYLPQIKDKKVGLVVNHTSMVGSTHLVDTLYKRGVSIEAIFAPEHGYTGNVERGKDIANAKDTYQAFLSFQFMVKRKNQLPVI